MLTLAAATALSILLPDWRVSTRPFNPREDVETIASGAHAAGAGGFTGVCAMPNTKPVTDNQATVGFVKRQGEAAGYARVYPYGAICLAEGRNTRRNGRDGGSGSRCVQ